MKAVILAAGRGSRLKPITNFQHKALLRVNEHPILSWQAHNLSRLGIDEIVVVTGYDSKSVVDQCNTLKDDLGSTDIITLKNNKWDSTENLYSLSLTDGIVRGEPLILLNCDIYPEEAIFDKVVRGVRQGDSIVPYDPDEPDEDALQLELSSKYTPKNILDKGHPDGDGATLGLFSLNREASKALFSDIDEYLGREDARAFWFEHSISRLFDSLEFSPFNVSELEWFEIDTEEDLRHASMGLGQSKEAIDEYINQITTDTDNN
jgi:choline kinase